MKITTWNVNGLRAALKNGFRQKISQISPDVLCLQEVKARPEQIPEAERSMPGYFSYWNPAARPGYSSVAIYSRKTPTQFNAGLGVERFDIEGRVIQLRYPNFWLFNIYFPSGQRGHDRVAYKLDFYKQLLKQCNELQARGENIIITGDFNTAHQEIDLARPKANTQTSGFLPEERAWISEYLNHGFVDVFRWLYPEKVQYTWWTYRLGARQKNIGWRLDYFLISEPLCQSVKEVYIHEDIDGSDHCPVSLLIDV